MIRSRLYFAPHVFAALMILGIAIGTPNVQAAADQAEWNPAPAGTQYEGIVNGELRTLKVTAVSPAAVTILENGEELECVGLQGRGQANHKTSDDDRKKAMELWPLAVGKKTQFVRTGEGRNGPFVNKISSEVTAIEDVVTPAGTFRSFLISTSTDNAPYFTADRKCWYAPDVGLCVKLINNSTSRQGGTKSYVFELKSVAKP